MEGGELIERVRGIRVVVEAVVEVVEQRAHGEGEGWGGGRACGCGGRRLSCRVNEGGDMRPRCKPALRPTQTADGDASGHGKRRGFSREACLRGLEAAGGQHEHLGDMQTLRDAALGID